MTLYVVHTVTGFDGKGVSEGFWAAFRRAERRFPRRPIHSCPDLARRLMMMEAELVHRRSNGQTTSTFSDEEAESRGGFAPPDNWKAIIKAGLVSLKRKRFAASHRPAFSGASEAAEGERVPRIRFKYSDRPSNSSGDIDEDCVPLADRNNKVRKRTSDGAPSGGGEWARARVQTAEPRGSPRGIPEFDSQGAANEARGGSTNVGGRPLNAAAWQTGRPRDRRGGRVNLERNSGMIVAAAVAMKEHMPDADLKGIVREAYGQLAREGKANARAD